MDTTIYTGLEKKTVLQRGTHSYNTYLTKTNSDLMIHNGTLTDTICHTRSQSVTIFCKKTPTPSLSIRNTPKFHALTYKKN